jgi:hypothetical protein
MYKERMVLNLPVMCLSMGTRGSAQDSRIGKATYLAVPLNRMPYAMHKGCVIFEMLESFNPL